MLIVFDTKTLVEADRRFSEFISTYDRLKVRSIMPTHYELDTITAYLQQTFDNIALEVGVPSRIRPIISLTMGTNSINLYKHWSTEE